MVDSLGDSLDRALEGAFTRRIPQSAQAQMTYLVRRLKGTKAAAEALGVSHRTVERYVAGKLKRPRQDLRGRMEREVKKRWQPQIRAKARKKAAATDGLVSTRARFGFTAAADTTDDARLRNIAQAGRPSGRTACTPPASKAPPNSSSSASPPRASRRCTSAPATPEPPASARSSPTWSGSPSSSSPSRGEGLYFPGVAERAFRRLSGSGAGLALNGWKQ